MNRTRTATLALVGACAIWGATFPLIEIATDALAATGTGAGVGALFLAARFGLAVVLLPLVAPRTLRRLDRPALVLGVLVGVPFAAGYLLQIWGLASPEVGPSESAFLTSLYVVGTPILAAILERRLPSAGVLVGIPLAAAGAAVVMGPPKLTLSTGAWLTVGCAGAFAVQILATDRASRRADPLALGWAMMLFTFAVSVALLGRDLGAGAAAVGVALGRPDFVAALLICTLLGTVVVVPLLNRYQKELPPARAAIVYTAEPVFAALISVALGRDRPTAWLALGAALILAGNLAAARSATVVD